MRRTLLPILGFFLISLNPAALAATGDAGMWGQRGFTRSFAAEGNFLYTADGRGVSAYDVSHPEGIRRLDVEWSDDETFDLALMGTSDLVVATSEGVERFAVAADGTLQRLGSVISTTPISHIAATPLHAAAVSGKTVTIYERDASGGLSSVRTHTFNNPVTAITASGEFLFVAVDRQPLYVFSSADAEPVALVAGADAVDMAVANGILWTVSDSDGLTAIDVSDPADPKVLTSVGRNELHPNGVAAAGTRVYAFEAPDRLLVFDATTPEAPQLVTTLQEWVNVIGASGTRLFLAGAVVESSGLAFDPGLIPRETGKPVRIFEMTTLATPVLAGEFTDTAGPVSGAWTDGSVAYVVDPPYLRVLDVSTTSEPREVTRLTIPNIQDRVRVKNGLAILYGRAFINLIDVSVPLQPRYLGTWDARGHPPSGAAILKRRVIEANEHSGLHIVDIDDPSNALQIGGRKWHYHDVAASDDAAYALLKGDLLIIEIADERTVVERDHIFVLYEQVDTVPPNASQPSLLLLGGGEGLRLYSLEDRFHPAELDFLPTTGLGVFATGQNSAYVARNGRLERVSLDGGQIALSATDDRVTSPMQMSIAGEKIVVADRYSVRVYGPDTAPPPPAPARRRSVRP